MDRSDKRTRKQEDLERSRAEFLAMATQELRTPLATIKGSTTALLSDPDLDPAITTQFFRIIDQQVDYMHELLADLLDAAHLESGSLSVHPVHVNVAHAIDEGVRRFVSAGGRSGLHVNIAPDLPPVMADRRRIVQVIVNLLSDAASRSPEDSPIRVTALRQGLHVAVSVTDKGPASPGQDLLACRGLGPRMRRECGVAPCGIQGPRGSPRRAGLGGKRRDGPRNTVDLHYSSGGPGRTSPADVTGLSLHPLR